jgi:hypothetical protein
MSVALIPPEEVTAGRVKEVFDNAFLDTAIDGETIAVAESGLKVFLAVDTERQLVHFWLAFGLRRGARPNDVLEFTSEVNKGLIMLRAWALENGVVFDYWLPYDAGLLPKQVISAYRWLRKITVDAIQAYNRKNVLA